MAKSVYADFNGHNVEQVDRLIRTQVRVALKFIGIDGQVTELIGRIVERIDRHALIVRTATPHEPERLIVVYIDRIQSLLAAPSSPLWFLESE